MILSDQQIYENRLKVVKFLKNSARKKAFDRLDQGNGQRCCLGHMCYVLDIQRRVDDFLVSYGKNGDHEYAPIELQNAVGLFNQYGAPISLGKSLVLMNDDKDMTPQEIGAYLESVIMGGPYTPWNKINVDEK